MIFTVERKQQDKRPGGWGVAGVSCSFRWKVREGLMERLITGQRLGGVKLASWGRTLQAKGTTGQSPWQGHCWHDWGHAKLRGGGCKKWSQRGRALHGQKTGGAEGHGLLRVTWSPWVWAAEREVTWDTPWDSTGWMLEAGVEAASSNVFLTFFWASPRVPLMFLFLPTFCSWLHMYPLRK